MTSFRHKPKLAYSGITVVLDNPSRFDLQRKRLLTGTAGDRFNDLIEPYTTRARVDIRTRDTITEGLLPGTKALLLFGQRLLPDWTGLDAKTPLDKVRGSLIPNKVFDDITTLATFLPQDTCDIVDYEAKHNEEALPAAGDNPEGDVTGRTSSTARANYFFWMEADVKKLFRVGFLGQRKPSFVKTETFNLYPSAREVQAYLKERREKTPDAFLCVDIETDCDQNITCIGFGFTSSTIMVVPFLRYDYTLAYSQEDWALIYRELALSLNKHTVVAHNSMFDLRILAQRYRMPVGAKVYDTMVAQHRCYPSLEKSLGHAVAYWLDESYHKDEGVFMPHSERQEINLWKYNAKDVATTIGVQKQIEAYAMKTSGLSESIADGNSMIRPYLINTLMGVRMDKERRDSLIEKNTRMMNQLLRILTILVGYDMNPNSTKQVPEYFYTKLKYRVVGRSSLTGKASCSGLNMMKMKLKYPQNAAIDVILAIRRLAKENGQLKFNTI